MISELRKLKSNSSGFTLIELMVVIIIVIILALALTPMFKELTIKSKYTEGISTISAISVKTKAYYAEHSYMPGAGGGSSGFTNGTYTYGISSLAGDYARTQRFLSQSATWRIQNVGTGLAPVADAAQLQSQIQQDLGIGATELAGKFFQPEDYQMRVDGGGVNANWYCYTIAACGSGVRSSPPIGTGYAVFNYMNSAYTARPMTIATWSRYTPMAGNTTQLYIYGNITDQNCNYIGVPGDTTLVTSYATLLLSQLGTAGWIVD